VLSNICLQVHRVLGCMQLAQFDLVQPLLHAKIRTGHLSIQDHVGKKHKKSAAAVAKGNKDDIFGAGRVQSRR
jgi:hypothetical protein